ncbi:hypothetical protein EIN_307700 [Entamoeba invadens IP1]|uniref:Ras-GAP domain-containing protein n=1 Tax=Entamoeba invadens IP1 TaxID=370355 RepID=A0A0A1TZ08_ENTIV|nr:hypothetical protein EIN_307700 [Entamoeba invadens IP1]ELP86744.1 hypothetical protein EIN_307700 [Entamoeba invadens IP1]|eukprot:XP_004186090.1 hypothetical protein EIN_307700 [Entamoeba invadens IP1]
MISSTKQSIHLTLTPEAETVFSSSFSCETDMKRQKEDISVQLIYRQSGSLTARTHYSPEKTPSLALKNLSPFIQISPRKTPTPNAVKKSPEEAMRRMLFNFPSNLLTAYCQIVCHCVKIIYIYTIFFNVLNFLKIFVKQDESNPFYIKSLLQFYSSRGKLTDLLIYLAQEEIEKTNQHNMLFRGNTSFTRIFTQYLNRYCSSFLNNTSIQVVQILLKKNTKNEEENELQNALKNTNDDLVFNNDFFDTLNLFTSILESQKNTFPSHLQEILRNVYYKVKDKRDEKQAINAVTTLLFLRFILTPFTSTPVILKETQKLIGEIGTITLPFNKNPLTNRQTTHFKLYVESYINTILFGPTNYALSHRGFNALEQENSLIAIINIIRQEMRTFSMIYKGDFDDVFSVIKGKTDALVNCSISYSTAEFVKWMDDREKLIYKENDLLKRNIETLKANICYLKSKIESAETVSIYSL